MARTINVVITGQFVKKDSKNAGVMGEGNVTTLHIAFDDSWTGYGKRIVWRNANGENPVSIVLFDPGTGQEGKMVYDTLIPAEPLALPGWCSFTVEGYKDQDGVHSVSMSVSDHLYVEESDSYYKPAEPSIGLAQQIMETLGQSEETIRSYMTEAKSWAVGGTGYRESEDIDNSKYYSEQSRIAADDSATSASEAEESADAANTSMLNAEKSAEESEKAKQAIFDMSVSAETLPPFDQAKAEKIVTGDTVHIKFSIPQGFSGSTVDASGLYGFHVDENGYLILSYTGENPPDFRIDENGDLIYTINDQDVNIGHVVIEGGGTGGGTTDYNNLQNKPSINGIVLQGNVSSTSLGIKDGEQGPAGQDGKSPYQVAVEQGYTGSEAEFYAALVSLKDAPFLPLSGGTLTGNIKVPEGFRISTLDGYDQDRVAISGNNVEFIHGEGGFYICDESQEEQKPIAVFYGLYSDENVTIRGVENPQNNNDATNKRYVDEKALPPITAQDENKILKVVSGKAVWESLPVYNGEVE